MSDENGSGRPLHRLLGFAARAGVVLTLVATAGWMPGLAQAADALNAAEHPVNVWVKQSPREGRPVPRFQWEGSADYDPHNNLWIHHGGHDGGPQGFATFTLDLGSVTWRQRFPNTAPPGVCCVDGSNVFDVANRRFVRFPGGSMNHGWQFRRGVMLKRSHVWLYDVDRNRWTNMRPPPYKAGKKYSREVLGILCSAGTYDPTHELAISFAGQTTGGGSDALHVYDSYTNVLTRLETVNRPGRRDGCGVAYDTEHDCLVVFGSQYSNDERTWIYRYGTNKWEGHDLTPRPPGRKDKRTYSTIPKMVYDPLNKVVVCVVWLSEKGHETWALDVGTMQWTRMNPGVEPEGSRSRTRNISFSRKHRLVILELESAAKKQAQVWTYRYKEAPADTRPAPPTNVKAATRSGAATLTWPAGTSAAVKAYNVYRAETDKTWLAEFTKIATVEGTTYEDADLKAGTVYLYKVAAVGGGGSESKRSLMARTQPRVLLEPVVSVLAANNVAVTWNAHPAEDVVGYNVYRGLATITTAKDPDPLVTWVKDITDIRKLNAEPLTSTAHVDTSADLTKKGDQAADYKYAVYAYVVRSVNRLGTESGPSPYALTIPSAPQNLFLREGGARAELKWDPNPEQGVAGYHVFRMGRSKATRLTKEPVKEPRFTHRTAGKWRYLVTAVDALSQEGEPSAPVWYGHRYTGFFDGDWHQ